MFDQIVKQLHAAAKPHHYQPIKAKKPVKKRIVTVDEDCTSITSNDWFETSDDPELILQLNMYYYMNKRPLYIQRLSDGMFGYSRSVNQVCAILGIGANEVRAVMGGDLPEVQGYKLLSYVPDCPFFDPVPYANIHTPVIYTNLDRGFDSVYESFKKAIAVLGYDKSECLPAFVYGAPVRSRSCMVKFTPLTYEELVRMPSSSWKPKNARDVILRNKKLNDYIDNKNIVFDSSRYENLTSAIDAWKNLIAM